MADANITERLEHHNRSVLIRSAQEKLQAGKTLTAGERKAIEAATNEQQRDAELPYLRRMPKKDFRELVGGDPKVYGDWERRLGFPWQIGSDYVDAIEILRWLRDAFAESRKQGSQDDESKRIKQLQIEKMERQAARERRELVEADAMRHLFGRLAQPLSRELTIAQRENPDTARRLIAALDEAEGILKQEFNGNGHA